MVHTMKRALRKYLLDGGGEEWDELLPYVAMGYRMSKQKAIGYSPYFFIFGLLIQARLQESQEKVLDLNTSTEELQAFLNRRGQAFKRVMPLAMFSYRTTTGCGAIPAGTWGSVGSAQGVLRPL